MNIANLRQFWFFPPGLFASCFLQDLLRGKLSADTLGVGMLLMLLAALAFAAHDWVFHRGLTWRATSGRVLVFILMLYLSCYFSELLAQLVENAFQFPSLLSVAREAMLGAAIFGIPYLLIECLVAYDPRERKEESR